MASFQYEMGEMAEILRKWRHGLFPAYYETELLLVGDRIGLIFSKR